MRAPSVKRLCAAFRDLEPKGARLIRKLAHAADDREGLYSLLNSEELRAFAPRRCEVEDYDLRRHSLRVERVLEAIDQIVGTCGVEALGSQDSDAWESGWPRWEYLNAGDTYATTLIYWRDSDALRLGCWGDIVERHDPKGEW